MNYLTNETHHIFEIPNKRANFQIMFIPDCRSHCQCEQLNSLDLLGWPAHRWWRRSSHRSCSSNSKTKSTGFSCPLGKLSVTAPNPFTHSRQPVAGRQLGEGSEGWKILDVKLPHGDSLWVEPRRQGSSDWGVLLNIIISNKAHRNYVVIFSEYFFTFLYGIFYNGNHPLGFLKGKEFLD